MSELPPAKFLDANLHNYINCATIPSPVEGIRVRAQLPNDVMAGAIITLRSQACKGLDGTNPIAGTDAKFTEEVKSPITFADFNIAPYSTTIKPVGEFGSLLVSWTITHPDGSIVQSPPSLVKVAIGVPGGGTCPE
ncbi:hypothetical protein [Pseudomonas sp. TWP3-2]|uniref:hypothetical protein n=1 Tax=Pseudomonas sp. TWP3-2 TaxID=2804574 RepID=UPI003CF28E32